MLSIPQHSLVTDLFFSSPNLINLSIFITDSARNLPRHRNHQIQTNNMQSTNMQTINVQPHSRNPPHFSRTALMNQQNANQIIGPNNQQILDHHDENLSEKEVYPGGFSHLQYTLYGHNKRTLERKRLQDFMEGGKLRNY